MWDNGCPFGLVVWFLLWVQEVPGSNPGTDPSHGFCPFHVGFVPEWLTGQTWNLLGFARTGSNPVKTDFAFVLHGDVTSSPNEGTGISKMVDLTFQRVWGLETREKALHAQVLKVKRWTTKPLCVAFVFHSLVCSNGLKLKRHVICKSYLASTYDKLQWLNKVW